MLIRSSLIQHASHPEDFFNTVGMFNEVAANDESSHEEVQRGRRSSGRFGPIGSVRSRGYGSGVSWQLKVVTDLARNNRCARRHGRRRLSPPNSMTGEPEDFLSLVCTPSSHTLELPELWLSLGKLFYSSQRGVSQCAPSQRHEKQSQDTSNSPAFFSTNSSSSLQQL
ncbi:uncharacterized [Tachysurus ichikawai]